MSYLTSEQSVASGRPIEAYDIAYGSTHWRITPNFEGFDYGGYPYSAAICKRTQAEQTGEIPKDAVEIEFPRGHELMMLCVQGVPEQEISLTIYRGHGVDFVTFWSGYLTSITINEQGIPICRFSPLSSDLPSVGGRRPVQRLCPHVLYGSQCGLNKENYKVEGTIEAIDGTHIICSAFEDAIWSNGSFGGSYPDMTTLNGCTYLSSSQESSTYQPSNVFDNNIGYPGWLSEFKYSWDGTQPLNEWIACKWTTGVKINRIRVQPQAWVDFYKWQARYVKIEASNNGVDWDKISVNNYVSNCSAYNTDEVEIALIRNYIDWAEFELNNSSTYTYYRLYCSYAWGRHNTLLDTRVTYSIGIGEIEMTNNDTQEGDYPELSHGLGSGGLFVVDNAERMIMYHTGNSIELNRTIPGLQIGQTFTAYAGCDHTPDTCRFKFGNILNYGGLEFLTPSNPYKSNIYY
jgi:Phage conserved hypothetical protein BR0599